ncbi:MAG: HAMP domain-containing protein, partial [Actinomycetia bacterium]|nr:HAMP domain-containing protein [Actinomycetes bacterium]
MIQTVFGRLSLKVKLSVLVLVPLVGMSYFAFSGAQDRRAEAGEAEDMQLLVELSVRTGDLLHETQKERGSTALYMSSKGTMFEAELEAQRTATAGPLAELTSFVEDNRDDLPPAVVSAMASALDGLGELETRRSQASSLSVPMSEVIGYYIDVNSTFLHGIAVAGTATSNAQLQGDSLAYLSFLHSKEKAGIERAQLAAAFASDQFNPGQLVTIVSLISDEKAYIGLFEEIASPEILDAFSEKQADPAVAEVDEYRALALENGVGGFGVDPTVWFETMTRRINLLKEVEDAQVAHISDTAVTIANDANSAFYRSLTVASIVFVVAGLFGVVTVAMLVSQLRTIAVRAKALASGDLSGEPLEVHSRDEVGNVAESFNEVSDHLALLEKVGSKARAIADGNLGAAILDDHVPGEIGESFSTMVDSLRTMVSQLKSGSQQLADSAGELNVASNSL